MTVFKGRFYNRAVFENVRFFLKMVDFEFLLDNVPKVVSSHWGDVGDAAILEHQ